MGVDSCGGWHGKPVPRICSTMFALPQPATHRLKWFDGAVFIAGFDTQERTSKAHPCIEAVAASIAATSFRVFWRVWSRIG